MSQQQQQCLLCNTEGRIVSADFKQIYSQSGQEPLLLDWWECHRCKGWFACPLPTPAAIALHWPTVTYNDTKRAEETAQQKTHLQRQVLNHLSAVPERGALLDIGCNFGHFMAMAQQEGWQPVGTEPNSEAASIAQAKGFEVYSDWLISNSVLAEKRFKAIAAIDVFYYDWHPFQTLETFYRMLDSGGLLVMRLTNKHLFLSLQRLIFRDSDNRNLRLTKTLKGQYHAVSTQSLGNILAKIGFTNIVFHPHSTAAPDHELGKGTRLSYAIADVMYALSMGTFNISPGVLLTARKP